MSLSVNCMTYGPGDRVAALLRLFRPVADEIVVLVDDRAPPGVADAVGAVADEVVLYPYAEPVDRPLAWIHEHCSGRWVLTIDDDEVPSAALLAALPQLVRADDVTHYFVPRRWLFPDAATWLSEPPWRPDYMLRLVRNDRHLLKFPDETHVPIRAKGPSRYLREPVYHADCIVSPPERRREKAARYERLRPGLRISRRPLNEAYYVPELVPDPRTEPVPSEDASVIRSVLDAPPVAGGAARARVRQASRDEIDRAWAGRELSETAYRARLTLLEEDPWIVRGDVRTFDVLVENLGDARWPWGRRSTPEIRLSYRWLDREGATVVPDGLRTPFPADVEAGETALVPVHVEAPAQAGSYVLEIDLVHEHVRWFEAAIECEVEVREAHDRRPAPDPVPVLPPAQEAPAETPVEPATARLGPAAQAKRIAWGLTPPFLFAALKRLLKPGAPSEPEPPPPEPELPPHEPAAVGPPEWEYVPQGWARARTDRRVQGWNVGAVAEAQRAKWPSFVRAVSSSGPLGVYHETVAGDDVAPDDADAHNMLVSYAYVLSLAARGRDRVSVLDWGGGPGHYFVVGRSALPGVELDYHVKEVPVLSELGRELLPDVRFHDDESCLERTYDLVLASGSLQYAEDWAELLARLGRAAARYLYVTRLPVAFSAPSFVVLQRAHAYGYGTEYLGWVLNRDELLDGPAAAQLELVREFLLASAFSAAGAPESPVRHRGFLWTPSQSRSRS